jgi:hypothetical protein
MLKRVGVLLLLAATLTGNARYATTDVRVHEWGTFTSLAGPDGRPIEWAPLGGPSELPCFVTILNPTSIKLGRRGLGGIKATVRMETPVLYFYASREETVRVRVRFQQGLITEWYPQARVPPVSSISLATTTGAIDWDEVRIQPGADPRFPFDGDHSHYYTARETDASPVRVGLQAEKFLFYRGLASFAVPITARLPDSGTIDIQTTGGPAITTLVLFQNDGERVGYRVVRNAPPRVTLTRPVLTDTVESLRADLQTLLTEGGLYAREAHAMVETWRETWFAPGTRVFYLMPRAMIDAVLPLQIDPQPLNVTRVFVGRVELGGPPVQTDPESPGPACTATAHSTGKP